ncbi:uncharacterized protein LOC133296080 [Gastrolobium bilobum]|uniref:uncharacterized protein LOC133296080 n=1 Tax=Gastrolobium bilobum TaxID=150636 RepID=UPI002AB1AF7F|nr:uncharacterized protein LOC133296080 [Gastrolobium bilobum]
MRFFLEFVSCCGSLTQRESKRALPPEEEERWLVQVPTAAADSSRRVFRKKRGRIGATDWKPSLGSISEDNAVLPRNSAVASAGKDVKKRSATAAGSGGAAKVRHRSYSDGYYGSAAMPTIMPTFSPTPFMF